MAEIMNNTVRLINMGAYMCIPGMVTVVPDHWLTNGRVVQMMDSGDLSNATAAPPTRNPIRPATPARPATPPGPKPVPPVPTHPPVIEPKRE